MAIPENRLSSTLVKGNYLPPDNLIPSLLVDYETGGVALNDPSLGLRVQLWTAYARGGKVFIYSELDSSNILLFERAQPIAEVSLAFDQNMRPFIAFVEGEGELASSWYWWYDTNTAQETFTELPEAVSPRATLDDKRKLQTGISDVILAYVRNNNLYFRMQRDRFTLEYLLYTGVNGRLVKIGMTDKNRLQFLLDSSLV